MILANVILEFLHVISIELCMYYNTTNLPVQGKNIQL